MLAGLCLAFLSLKPQFACALGLMLLGAGRWRCLGFGALAIGALVAGSIALFGKMPRQSASTGRAPRTCPSSRPCWPCASPTRHGSRRLAPAITAWSPRASSSNTGRIKSDLGWRLTRTNGDMLLAASRYYAAHRAEIAARRDVSAHRQAADRGVLRILKGVS